MNDPQPNLPSDSFDSVYAIALASMDKGFCLLEKVNSPPDQPADFRYLLTNPAFEKQTGLHDVVGKTVRQVVPQVETSTLAVYDQVVTTGVSCRFEVYVAQLDLWIDGNAFRISQQPAQLAVLFANTTERKKMEASLQANQERPAFLLKLSDTLRAETGVEAVGNRAVQMIAQQLGADRVYLVTLTPGDDNIVVTHEVRRPDMPPLLGSYRGSDFPAAMQEIFQHTIVYTDVRTDAHLTELDRRSLAGLGAVGFMATPIRRSSQAMIWAAGAVSSGPRTWTAADVTLFEDAIERTWTAVERARTEDILHQQEQRIQLTLEAAQMATWEWDLTSDQVYWNEQHFHLLGMAVQPNPLPAKAFLEHLHPDDAESIKIQLQQTIQQRTPYDAEFRVIREDGIVRWMSGYGRVTAEQDSQPVRVSGIMLDITDRKETAAALYQSEARLRAILESAQDYAIFTTDLAQRVTSWNTGAQAMFGYREEAMLHQSVDILYNSQDRQAGVPRLEAKTAIEQGRFDNERWHSRQDGSLFYGSGVVTPLRDETGTIIGLLKVMRDLTTQKRAEQALQEADQRKDEFLAMLAHELRNPLTPVRTGLQVLSLAGSDEPTRDTLLPIMNRQMDHVMRLVDDLLDVSRISRGRIDLQKEPLDLTSVVDQAAQAIRPLYETTGRQLHVALPTDALWLNGDATRLHQVVINLLTNGLRYTREEGQVWLSLAATGSDAVLRVRDNGIGLAADQLQVIFGLFVQVDTSLARSNSGLGLGLTLVQQLVELHGGRIEAFSPGLDQGSEFVIHLPVDQA